MCKFVTMIVTLFVATQQFWKQLQPSSRDFQNRWEIALGSCHLVFHMAAPCSGSRVRCVVCSSTYCLYQGGDYAISGVCLSFILSVCARDYCKSDEPISLKLGIMIGSTSRKNLITFGGDLVPHRDFRSLFQILHHRGIGT